MLAELLTGIPLRSSIYPDGGSCGWLVTLVLVDGIIQARSTWNTTIDRLQHHRNIQQINILCQSTVSTVLLARDKKEDETGMGESSSVKTQHEQFHSP